MYWGQTDRLTPIHFRDCIKAQQNHYFVMKRYINCHDHIDRQPLYAYNVSNWITETVDAEITAMMPLQRACNAESQVRNKLSNGPLRAQSNGTSPEYSATPRAGVKCRGYVGILLSARIIPWIKVAPRIVFYYSSLTDGIILSRAFCLFKLLWQMQMSKEFSFWGGNQHDDATQVALYAPKLNHSKDISQIQEELPCNSTMSNLIPILRTIPM